MALEKKLIGTRLFFIDRGNKLLFTKTELEEARTRYAREYAKAVNQNG